MNPFSYSKENIKNRMFKRAAALWDIRDVDNLDPIVRLMIEALASEVFSLSGEMQDMEERLLNKLALQLTPTAFSTAMPAHGIIHAQPYEPQLLLPTTDEFHYKNPALMKKHHLKRMVFSPVTPRLLHNLRADTLIADGEVYQINSKNMKDKILRLPQRSPLFNHCLWVGLDTDAAVDNLNKVSFYFDFPYLENKERYFQLLAHTRWSINQSPLTMQPGLPLLHTEDKEGDKSFLQHYDLIEGLQKEILAHYNNRYLTVAENRPIKPGDKTLLPEELEELFDKGLKNSMSKPLLWIKILFPPHINNQVIQETFISCNAVPAANKYVQKTDRRVDTINSIIPLAKAGNEALLTVDRVSDEKGKIYLEDKAGGFHPSVNGTYALRRGGTERFSHADARLFLTRLLDLMRDESVAFTNVERDTLDENTAAMLKHINHLEHKINLKGDREDLPSYLIIDHNEKEALYVEATYWLTNGPLANGLSASEPLSYNGEAEILPTTIQFLSATRGGKDAPSMEEKKRRFRNILISRGAIYSVEDITSFCMAQYGHLIDQVNIKNGCSVGQNPGEGLVKTIDVHLKLKQALPDQEAEELSYNLLTSLKAKAPEDFNFRLFVAA